jgi:hypothetical protein
MFTTAKGPNRQQTATAGQQNAAIPPDFRDLTLFVKTVPASGCPKTVLSSSSFSRATSFMVQVTAMGTLLATILEITGIRRFFTGVSVEMPAYFVPNFKVVEIEVVPRVARSRSTRAAN